MGEHADRLGIPLLNGSANFHSAPDLGFPFVIKRIKSLFAYL